MSTKILVFFALFVLPFLTKAQLTGQEAKEDLQLFRSIIEAGHPGLFEYNSKVGWDSICDAFETEVKDEMSPMDLFSRISLLGSYVHDGHLLVIPPTMDSVPHHLPLLVKVLDGRLYTDGEHFGIPLGSEVYGINGDFGSDIVNNLIKYTSSDGYNMTKRYRQLEEQFAIYHGFGYGYFDAYHIRFRTLAGEVGEVTVPSLPLEEVGQMSVHRSSFFAKYHNQESGVPYVLSTVGQRWPYLTFADENKTAILTVNSFGLEPKEFKSRLVKLFQQIRRKGIKNLVIDIRRNEGGYRINAIHLYSFLAKGPFQQRVLDFAKVNSLPYAQHLADTMSDFESFFETYFGAATKTSMGWELTEDPARHEMKPARPRFKGKVYVLIGGKTFSAGSAFALNAKNDPRITLIGEETGGGYYTHTGQFPVVYELPHSRIKLRMSLVQVNKYVIDTTVPKGSGVLPDVQVALLPEDLAVGRDAVLDHAIMLIRSR